MTLHFYDLFSWPKNTNVTDRAAIRHCGRHRHFIRSYRQKTYTSNSFALGVFSTSFVTGSNRGAPTKYAWHRELAFGARHWWSFRKSCKKGKCRERSCNARCNSCWMQMRSIPWLHVLQKNQSLIFNTTNVWLRRIYPLIPSSGALSIWSKKILSQLNECKCIFCDTTWYYSSLD